MWTRLQAAIFMDVAECAHWRKAHNARMRLRRGCVLTFEGFHAGLALVSAVHRQVMGGEQAANVLAQVRQEQAEKVCTDRARLMTVQ